MGLADLYEARLGGLIVAVRAVLRHQTAVRLFDLVSAGDVGDAQNLVVISHHKSSLTVPDGKRTGRMPRVMTRRTPHYGALVMGHVIQSAGREGSLGISAAFVLQSRHITRGNHPEGADSQQDIYSINGDVPFRHPAFAHLSLG